MSSRHPYNAVFPVAIVFSVVFSILSLPFFLYRSQPEADSSSLHQEFQPVLESQNRDLTIRYIGAAMVLSIIAGISTVELQRRRQPAASTTLQPCPEPNQTEMELLPNPLSCLEFDPLEAFDPDDFGSDNFSPDNTDQIELVESFEMVSPTVAKTAGSSLTQNGIQDGTSRLTNSAPLQPQMIAELNELNQDYSTCRVWVQHSHRRLFAIQVEGQFYSFFRLLPTQESARQTALQLSETLNRTVITPIEQNFAVWVWQPEAELELEST